MNSDVILRKYISYLEGAGDIKEIIKTSYCFKYRQKEFQISIKKGHGNNPFFKSKKFLDIEFFFIDQDFWKMDELDDAITSFMEGKRFADRVVLSDCTLAARFTVQEEVSAETFNAVVDTMMCVADRFNLRISTWEEFRDEMEARIAADPKYSELMKQLRKE